MIPLTGDVKELKYVKNVVVTTADAEIAASGIELKYEVGTMMEIPRACLMAHEMATEAESPHRGHSKQQSGCSGGSCMGVWFFGLRIG